ILSGQHKSCRKFSIKSNSSLWGFIEVFNYKSILHVAHMMLICDFLWMMECVRGVLNIRRWHAGYSQADMWHVNAANWTHMNPNTTYNFGLHITGYMPYRIDNTHFSFWS
ncbi:hypothetical protein ACJX0J_012480, partial [Zea mays]